MEFRNLTPFSVMQYSMLDLEDSEHYVVAMKVGFKLEHISESHFFAHIMDAPAMPLCQQDEYAGEVNKSQVLQENDLAPYKPHCDIIVNGTAYTPGGTPAIEFPVNLRVLTDDNQVLLNKKLQVTGERFFRRNSLTGQWSLTAPLPFTSLPLNYHYAFGGECRIEHKNDNPVIVPEKYQLTKQQQAEHPQSDNPPLAHSAYTLNPLGMGYTQPWYAKASQQLSLPAPRIMDPSSPFTLASFLKMMNGETEMSAAEFQPAGFAIQARIWKSRQVKAGTYDQEWLNNRHPRSPTDFDFSYWNAAPADQQIAYPPPGLRFELKGLHPKGDISIRLPPHRAGIVLRMQDGALIPQLMHTDTVILDTEKLTVSMTWRFVIRANIPLRVMEARYISDDVQGEKKWQKTS